MDMRRLGETLARRAGCRDRALRACHPPKSDWSDAGWWNTSRERGIGGCPGAHRTIAPGIIAGRRDLEHGAHQPYRIGIAMILDEAKTHVRVPAKIAIDFFKMSRSMRSRSFSWRSRAISEAWSAGIGVACVVGRHAADAGSCRSFSTQRRSTESRRPSSLATDVIDRPLDTTSSAACRLYSSVNDRR